MKPHHKLRPLLLVCLTTISIGLQAGDKPSADDLFSGPVPRLQIEIPDEGLKVLRSTNKSGGRNVPSASTCASLSGKVRRFTPT